LNPSRPSTASPGNDQAKIASAPSDLPGRCDLSLPRRALAQRGQGKKIANHRNHQGNHKEAKVSDRFGDGNYTGHGNGKNLLSSTLRLCAAQAGWHSPPEITREEESAAEAGILAENLDITVACVGA